MPDPVKVIGFVSLSLKRLNFSRHQPQSLEFPYHCLYNRTLGHSSDFSRKYEYGIVIPINVTLHIRPHLSQLYLSPSVGGNCRSLPFKRIGCVGVRPIHYLSAGAPSSRYWKSYPEAPLSMNQIGFQASCCSRRFSRNSDGDEGRLPPWCVPNVLPL